jgi:hypothetical protein
MIKDYSYSGGKAGVKKDYQVKNFNNPYFHPEKKSLTKHFNTKLYLQILLALFLLYVIIYSDLFKIAAVGISGTDLIDQNEIRSMAEKELSGYKLFLFPRRNMIFFNQKKLEREINSRYALNKLEIKKSWHRLDINLEEKVAYLIATDNQRSYFVDLTGTIIKELSPQEVIDYSPRFPSLILASEIKIGDKPISGRFVNYVLELDNDLKGHGIKVKDYQGGGVDQVFMNAEAGWQAKFSINTNIKFSLENLYFFLDKKLKGKTFQYIDLRIGDHVYVFPEQGI